MARTRSVKVKDLQPKEKRRKPLLVEVGSENLNPFGLFENEELLDQAHVSIQDLNRMIEQDGQAQSLYRLITMPIRAGVPKIQPADAGSAEADFIQKLLLAAPEEGGMKTPWNKVIASIAKAVLTGMEIHEKVYEERNGFIILDKIGYRPRLSYFVHRTSNGDWDFITQNLPSGTVEIKRNKLLHFVVGSEFNPLYGKSMLHPAYYHWEKKHKLYYIAHLAYALNAIPIRKGRLPPNPEEAEKLAFKRAIDNVGVNTSIIVPEGYELELTDARQVADSMNLIQHHDVEMAKAVLGQVIELGTSGGAGSYALSETHLSMLLLADEVIQQEISGMINCFLIPELIDWNFGSGKYPKLIIEPAYTDRRTVVKEIFEHVSGARQVNFSAEFMFELERNMAEQLGFADKIDYQGKKQSLIDEMRKQQQTQSGVQAPAAAKIKPKLPPGFPQPPNNQPPTNQPPPTGQGTPPAGQRRPTNKPGSTATPTTSTKRGK